MTGKKKPDLPEQELPSDDEPRIFAVNKDGNNVRFTRRNFLELMATTTAAVALNSCSIFQPRATLLTPSVDIYA